MHLVIFEGCYWTNFAPVALSKPTFMLHCGMGTLLEKQLELLRPDRLTLWVRPQLAEYCRVHVAPQLKIPVAVNQPLDDQPALITTGRTLHLANFELPPAPSVVVEEKDLIRFAHVKSMPGLTHEDAMNRSDRWLSLLDLPHTMPQARFVDYLWQLISWNEEALISDFVRWKNHSETPKDGPWHLIHPENVSLSKGAKLSPGCVLDASKGPIVLDEGASIGANAVVQGPCYVGKHSTIHPLALIRPGVSIGMMCKIGGEVSNTIVCPYTNKAHDGFLGDSYLGSWVNFGAGTTTSNLKNTYGEVTMRIGSREYKTGRRMLGSIVGDHTKTAIGTRLNTGSYIGYNCLLAGNGLTANFIPSFTFWTPDRTEKYDLPRAASVAGKVMERRDEQWTPTDDAIQQYVAQIAPTIEA